MLHAKFQIILTVPGEKPCKGFYHIWEWWPSWSCDLDHLNKLSFPLLRDAIYEV